MTVYRLLQLTDTHLFSNKTDKLLGLQTYQSCLDVVTLAKNIVPTPDILLCTGDLSQDHSLLSYQYLDQILAEWAVPFYALCGNHDSGQLLSEGLQRAAGIAPSLIDLDKWQIILLNSNVVGQVSGELDQAQLAFLQSSLDQSQDKWVIIALHHPPISHQTLWLDRLGLQNSEQFWCLLEAYSHVKAVIWGHVHQAFDGYRGAVRLLSTPSTCIQFAPCSDDFRLDAKSPGCRLLDLLPDGQIQTQVLRLNEGYFIPDYETAKGY